MLWSGIRSIINSKLNIGSSISCLTHNGVEVDDSKQMANIFNNVFVNTAKKINENIPRTRKSPLDYLSFQNESSFFISPASPEEIKVSINSLKSGKAVGPHSIPIYLLKILSEYIAVPLCDIVNESFSSGIFPDMMKLAKVIPLYNGQLPSHCNYANYVIHNGCTICPLVGGARYQGHNQGFMTSVYKIC